MKYTEPRPKAVMDIECFRNYFLIGFKDVQDGRRKRFELFNDNDASFNRRGVAKILRGYCVVTFNGNFYDMLMLALSMQDVGNIDLKKASDRIIQTRMKPWEFRDYYGAELPGFVDHIDLAEVSPGAAQMPSLKLYAGKMHSRKMQDLPIDHDDFITESTRFDIIEYNDNDLDVTHDMLDELSNQLAIRAAMSDRYKIDMRSKSDAQIAEAVIKSEVEQRTGRKLYKEAIDSFSFNYEPPSFIDFKTEYMREVFREVREAKFKVRLDGYVEIPSVMKAPITIGDNTYQMGIGGLHTKEKRQTVYADDTVEIQDRDVRGYYPNMIIGSGRAPKNMGIYFQPVFRAIVDDREKAKAEIVVAEKRGDKAAAKDAKDRSENGKIMSNGTFGKTGSPFSPLYSPTMLIQTTVTGQLAILMAIERATLAGYRVISANTDGFVTVLPRRERDDFDALMFDWECDTGLVTEATFYSSVHSRDVNNYFAFTEPRYPGEKVKVKAKGIFAPSGRGLPAAAGLKKNPDADVCSHAVIAFLQHGTAIEDTIDLCADVRQMLRIRREKGGAGYRSTLDPDLDQDFVGKAVRWYYAVGERGCFYSRVTGGRVAETTGARPLMELPEHNELPDDIDYNWYVREAYARLYDVGVDCPDPALAGREGFIFANRAEQKTVHKVDLTTGIALCGVKQKDRREPWEEHEEAPEGRRYCGKCRRADEL